MRAAVAWAGPQCPPPEAPARESCGRLCRCRVSRDVGHLWCVSPASQVCTALFVPLSVNSVLKSCQVSVSSRKHHLEPDGRLEPGAVVPEWPWLGGASWGRCRS
ncbi:hypothetical protein MDA_GLEAN10013400 [Myotis davidii]|uniref:Uncharacterized protein n=1 Tax=Myotis davidii TaxID=225400 RepID=L5LWR7_MYODS|nr:hypothetical protein MDA_GLEAN10013400 [Myotis davidii]